MSNGALDRPVFTIGHSNHPFETFLGLLTEHHVEAVVDTRSYPRSKFAPQYDSAALSQALREQGVQYIYLGKELGGRPDGAQFYDEDGRVFYSRVAESSFFQRALARLEKEIPRLRLVLLCSEENPSICHRRLLIARELREHGIAVHHIRADGTVESEEDLLAREAARSVEDAQLTLFEQSGTPKWKSIPSVLPKRLDTSVESAG
jgi:uncharacterized protein (DUF488 family)